MTTTESPPTDTPVPTTAYLASLAAILDTTNRDALAQTFAELADEALVLAAKSRTAEWFRFWGNLHETFHHESQKRLAPPKPKRRWFR
ncbi:hypothetical protein AAW14_06290 [Streptomyces hygroscopicus]|uniref:hypothetical protein n=1 Tax=Streptomyces hygroscopicus TaxID=1912 RepID=UPI00223EB681|nr:hypothetical protein [Streptomyces hygroscopicus]MCW7941650.1 hypothetical protein [Streptomyces hygroscopicus]